MALEFPRGTSGRLRAVFGDDATVGGHAVRGVFTNAYVDVQGAEATSPALQCVADDVPGVAHGDVVLVPGHSFTGRVASVQPDGYGWVTLLLHRTA